MQNGTTMDGAVRRGHARAKTDGLGSARASCVLFGYSCAYFNISYTPAPRVPSALPLKGELVLLKGFLPLFHVQFSTYFPPR